MPELTIYTDPNRLGQCEVPPFVVGDTDSYWKILFHNGTDYHLPANVSLRIGHINGLTQARSGAFKLKDRAGNHAVYDITESSGIFSLALDDDLSSTPPSLVGSAGVYLARGAQVARGIKQVFLASKGRGYVTPPRVVIAGDGVGAAAVATIDSTFSSSVKQVRNLAKVPFGEWVTASLSGGGGTGCELDAPQIDTFTVTGLKPSGAVLVTGPVGKVQLTFTGEVAEGFTAAEGYAQFDAAGAFIGLVLTRQGTYTSRPLVSFVGTNNSGGGVSPYSVLPDGYATYKQQATKSGAGYTSTPIAAWSPAGSGLTLGTPTFDASGWIAEGYCLKSIPVTAGGSGYNYVPRVRISGTEHGDNKADTDAHAVVIGGVVTAIVINTSAIYSAASVSVSIEAAPSVQSQDIVVDLEQQSYGEVKSISITSGGSGYSASARAYIVCSGAPGGGAICRPVVAGGVIAAVEVIEPGAGYSPTSPPSIAFVDSTGTGAAGTVTVYKGGAVSGITITAKGAGYSNASVQLIADDGIGSGATAGAVVEVETHEVCYKSEEVDQEVISGVSVTPHTDGRTDASGAALYDNALITLKPRIVADAALTVSDGEWVGTLDPVNDYVSACLKMRRSCTLDLQVFGDGRMLFMGALTVLNKIA